MSQLVRRHGTRALSGVRAVTWMFCMRNLAETLSTQPFLQTLHSEEPTLFTVTCSAFGARAHPTFTASFNSTAVKK